MKDLGTVAVMAWSLPGLVAFYPDGAWWIPCVMEHSAGLLSIADSLGIDESFCPVRAMLGAFENGEHFPIPDLLTCSVGATCDDFSAIAQRLEHMGHAITWWEMPARRRPDPGEPAVRLPGGFVAPVEQVEFVESELRRLAGPMEELAGCRLSESRLAAGIRQVNEVRRLLGELRLLAYGSDPCPLPALELLIAEMLALHYCSDATETRAVLQGLLAEARRRVAARAGVLPAGAPRIFWVNPVADLRVMNLLEQCGGRLCGTEYLFCHSLEQIDEALRPMEALARTALADPMVGSAADRAERICSDASAAGAEAVIVSRIPGASHCATEGAIIAETVGERLGIPCIEIEVPTLSDAYHASLCTRLSALTEAVHQRREK